MFLAQHFIVDRQAANPYEMRAEPVMLSGTAARSLLFPIDEIIAVYSFDESGNRIDYEQGVDYEQNGTAIRRTSGSNIPDHASYQLPLDENGKFQWSADPRVPPSLVHSQVYVDYRTTLSQARTITGLASAPVRGRIVVSGDSVTGAAHTVAREAHGNDSQGYAGLLRAQFRNVFDVQNINLNGGTISFLASHLSEILSDPPSALIIAFGMNEHAQGPSGVASFKTALTDIVDDAQAAGVYVILLGFFAPNPLWENAAGTNVDLYNEAIADVATQAGAAFVDIRARWDSISTYKDAMIDLTGDNFHHPNAFGHRVYFSAILPFLLSGEYDSRQFINYIPTP